jgi:hypothetical protein
VGPKQANPITLLQKKQDQRTTKGMKTIAELKSGGNSRCFIAITIIIFFSQSPLLGIAFLCTKFPTCGNFRLKDVFSKKKNIRKTISNYILSRILLKIVKTHFQLKGAT